ARPPRPPVQPDPVELRHPHEPRPRLVQRRAPRRPDLARRRAGEHRTERARARRRGAPSARMDAAHGAPAPPVHRRPPAPLARGPAPRALSEKPTAALLDNQVYYFEVGRGSWRGAFSFRISDRAAFDAAPLSTKDRLLARGMDLAHRLTGDARIDSTVWAR